MDLMTIQLSKWRLARNRDITVMDTTVKSGFSIYRPSWDMVMGYKSGQLTWDEYTQQYYQKMNASWKDPKERPLWLATIESTEPTAIACMCRYEGPETHCHRFLLKDILDKLCQKRGIDFRYYGELSD